MDPTDNPFDDPEVAELMRQSGIVHKPGMAAELLEELAPLLEAEGVDLSDPDSVPDIDALNAALARATEQHNLRRFTPVSKERELALTVLIEFTESLEAGQSRRAENVLDSVGPEATDTRPAASQVIGASLGLLDNWFTDAALGGTLETVEVPKWRGPARSTATRIIRAARKGEAYASLEQLIVRHGGLFVLQSAALAVAGSILAYSAQRGTPLLEASDELFSHQGTRGDSGPALGADVPPHLEDDPLLHSYSEWLETDLDEEVEDFDAERTMFSLLLEITRMEGLDLGDPDDIDALIELLLELPDDEALGSILETLHRYVHFQLEERPLRWAQAHDSVEAVLFDSSPQMAILHSAAAASRAIPEKRRQDVMSATRVMRAIPRLFEWLGESRPVTATGNLRRKDLQPVAKMLDIHAVGVAKLPEYPTWPDPGTIPGADPDDVVHAQSMANIPVLPAWWEALSTVGALAFTTTRVNPGPQSRPLRSLTPPVEQAEVFLSVFVREVLTRRLDMDPLEHSLRVVAEIIAHLTDALDPDRGDSPIDEVEQGWWEDPTRFYETRELEHAGLITFSDHRIEVPEELAGAVAIGTLMAMARFNETIALLYDDHEED